MLQRITKLAGTVLLATLFISLSTVAALPTQISSISKVQSGLVAQDTLTTGDLSHWILGGDAVAQGAKYTSSENSSGLYLGVQAHQDGAWSGYYAVTPNTSAYLFHAVLTLPYRTIPNGNFNTGLYVQTSAPNVNYVSCSAGVNSAGYYWQVVLATGTTIQATQFQVLYFQWLGNTPLTRDCTIITNGQTFLHVYLDGALVYSNDTMSLTMPPPFNAFLEVQSTDGQQMLFAKYNDYYATLNGAITVTNAPPGSTVTLVDSTGNTLTTAQADLSGTATLNVEQFHYPLQANIQVSLAGIIVASTNGAASMWGGDIYKVDNMP